MQGDIVKAAKWLGGSLVLTAVVCVVGFHPAVTGRTVSIQKVPAPDADMTPSLMSPERVHGGAQSVPAAAYWPVAPRCDNTPPVPTGN